MSTSSLDWIGNFPNGELESHISDNKKLLYVVLDSEYTRNGFEKNTCLSFQLSVLSQVDGKYRQYIHYMNTQQQERLTFSEIVLLAFMLVGVPQSDINGYHIIFICHFCSAEFSMIKDREKIAPYLEFLYKTVITFKSIDLTLKLDDGTVCKISFEVSDTMLLLPPTHKSLEKASTLLDEKFHKKELTQSEKERMDILLRDNPKRFEEYAIHDADITLRLFIKLQYTLNKMNGSQNVRFTTIGSATVKHFVKQIDKELFKSQFGKSNKIYQKGLSLAKRAYMGGLNSSYFVGECEGELFLDIDFSSAYPTVMNLLEVSDFGQPIVKVKDDPFSLGDIND